MDREGTRGAVLATVYAGIAFGVFWIPIRALEDSGLGAAWAAVMFTGLPLLFILPMFWMRRGQWCRGNARGLMGGVLAGVAFGFYTLAFLHTDVVRAVLLFYLMPVWGFMLGRLFLSEAITPTRWAAVALGFAGIAVIFGAEGGFPMPRNAGDWLALASGMVWACASLLILLDKRVSVGVHVANFFLVATLIGAVGVVIAGQAAAFDIAALSGTLPWFVPVTLLLTLPTGIATIYGPTRINPGIVGLLFMAEVAVAAISAALLSGEAFGMRETLGVLLLITAGLLVPLREMRGVQG